MPKSSSAEARAPAPPSPGSTTKAAPAAPLPGATAGAPRVVEAAPTGMATENNSPEALREFEKADLKAAASLAAPRLQGSHNQQYIGRWVMLKPMSGEPVMTLVKIISPSGATAVCMVTLLDSDTRSVLSGQILSGAPASAVADEIFRSSAPFYTGE